MAASVAPFTGPKPANFDETSERAVVITCCVIVGVAMLLRTLGRYALKLKMNNEFHGAGHFLRLDDVFNFFAVLTFYGLAAAVLIAVDRGMGTHVTRVMWLHGSKGVDHYNLAVYICALTYNLVLGLIKLSVLALYRRILQGVPSRTLNIVNWCVFGLIATNTIINVFMVAFQCNPIHAAFDSSIKGECINTSAFYLGNAITGIITDSAVYLLAIPIIRPLQMDQRRKLVILLTLLVGLFAVITSCIRLSFLPSLLINPDTTWAMGVPMDWSVVEPTVGIVVSSMPAIRSVVFLWDPKHGRSQNSSSFKSQLESRGHIQLHDYAAHVGKEEDNGMRTTIVGSGKKGPVEDSDSERNLIYQGTGLGNGGIFKTTEVKVSSV